jgi:hypothetical protein
VVFLSFFFFFLLALNHFGLGPGSVFGELIAFLPQFWVKW